MNEGNMNMPPVGKAVEKNEIKIGDQIHFDNKPLMVVSIEGDNLKLKQVLNAHDRDDNYETTISREDFESINSLGDICGENAGSGENYAPANGDVLRAALDYLTRKIEDKKARGSQGTSSYEVKKLGDRDSELVTTITTLFKDASETAVFLSSTYLKSGFPEQLKDILKNLMDNEVDSRGHDEFSVHFTGRVYDEPQEKPVKTYVG